MDYSRVSKIIDDVLRLSETRDVFTHDPRTGRITSHEVYTSDGQRLIGVRDTRHPDYKPEAEGRHLWQRRRPTSPFRRRLESWSRTEEIIERLLHGETTGVSQRQVRLFEWENPNAQDANGFFARPHVKLKDGSSLSIQASGYHSATPEVNQAMMGQSAKYSHVEVGTEHPHHQKDLTTWDHHPDDPADGPDYKWDPHSHGGTDYTVGPHFRSSSEFSPSLKLYDHVPVGVVSKLIAKSGGLADPEDAKLLPPGVDHTWRGDAALQETPWGIKKTWIR